MVKKAVSLLLALLMVASVSVLGLADEEVAMPEGTAVLEETEEPVEEEAAPEAVEELDAPAEDGVYGSLTVKVEPKQTSVKQGKTVEFEVKIDAVDKGFCAFELGFDFDETAFSIVSAEGKLGTDNKGYFSKTLVWYTNQNVTPAADTVIATFTLKAAEDAALGSQTVGVTVKAVNFENPDTNKEDWLTIGTNKSCSVTIEEKPAYTPGDINGDDKVTSADVLALQKYLVHMSVSVVEEALDPNGDGRTTSADVLILKKYLVHMVNELF